MDRLKGCGVSVFAGPPQQVWWWANELGFVVVTTPQYHTVPHHRATPESQTAAVVIPAAHF